MSVNLSIICSITGFSLIGNKGLGKIEVNGFILVPFPPAIIITVFGKVLELFEAIKPYEPNIVFIQEIAINMALKVFGPHFQVFINIETPSNDGVGIVTLIDKQIKVIDHKIGEEGRTIGVKTREIQFWNVYPKSGTNNKNWSRFICRMFCGIAKFFFK